MRCGSRFRLGPHEWRCGRSGCIHRLSADLGTLMSPPPDKACPRCDTLLRYIARRTVRTASSAYYLHVRACPGCGCAYGDTEPVGQPSLDGA
jgi:hypothetical protein